MSANRTIALISVLLAATVLLVAAGPAVAHPWAPTLATAAPASPPPTGEAPPAAAAVTPEDHPVSESPGLTPWIAAIVLLLAGLVLRRRSSRRTLVLCLVLLLTLFAFENALHSVHHGFDPKLGDTCALAMASTHLSAVTVDGVAEASIALAPAGHATQPAPAPLPARWLGPDQGRAPPARTA
jgi:hypothetical protein